jgi:predicted ATPase
MELIKDDGDTVPITILTGFLGAGKTTLLNRIVDRRSRSAGRSSGERLRVDSTSTPSSSSGWTAT